MDDELSRWLVLREPADRAARSQEVTRALADALAGRDRIQALDLGTGTGANVRYLIPHLPRQQEWLVADRDAAVLAAMVKRMSTWASSRGLLVDAHANGCRVESETLSCRIQARVVDLGQLDDELFEGRQLVTASALLDLTSSSWMTSLARGCRSAGAAALFALTYNGWSSCTPLEPEDDMVRDLLNRHQLKDKGLGGPAAGPAAAELSVHIFRDAGFQVRAERTDWDLGAADHEMQRVLVDGWSEAAAELEPGVAAAIERWRLRRQGHIDAGRSRIAVGHLDMAAWIPA